MDNKCVANNNCWHIYIIYFIIHTVYPRLSKTLHNQQLMRSYNIKHFNDIHIVIKLTFHISEFFSYLNKNIFCLHNEVNNITV